MTENIGYWLGDTMVIVLISMAALGLITGIASLKSFKKNSVEALAYFTLSAFFWALHLVWVFYAPPDSILFCCITINFWNWLVFLFTPALVIVFVLDSMYWFVKSGGWPALIRLFFGVTLPCLVYMVGQEWSVVIKGSLSVLWVYFLFRVEFPPKPKKPAFVFVTRRLL